MRQADSESKQRLRALSVRTREERIDSQPGEDAFDVSDARYTKAQRATASDRLEHLLAYLSVGLDHEYYTLSRLFLHTLKQQ